MLRIGIFVAALSIACVKAKNADYQLLEDSFSNVYADPSTNARRSIGEHERSEVTKRGNVPVNARQMSARSYVLNANRNARFVRPKPYAPVVQIRRPAGPVYRPVQRRWSVAPVYRPAQRTRLASPVYRQVQRNRFAVVRPVQRVRSVAPVYRRVPQTQFARPAYGRVQQSRFVLPRPVYKQVPPSRFARPAYRQVQPSRIVRPAYRQIQASRFSQPQYRRVQQRSYSRPNYTPYRMIINGPALYTRGWEASSSGTNVGTGTNSHTVSNSKLKAPGQTTTNTHVITNQQTGGRIRSLGPLRVPYNYHPYRYPVVNRAYVRGKVAANARVNAKASAGSASNSNSGSSSTSNGGSRTTSGGGGWGGGMGAGYGTGSNAWGVGYGGGGGGSAGSIPSGMKGIPGLPTNYNGISFPGMPSLGFPGSSGGSNATPQGSSAGTPASNTGAPASSSGAPASNTGAPASNTGAPASSSGTSGPAGASYAGGTASYAGAQGLKNRKPSSTKGKQVALKPKKGLNTKLKAFQVVKGGLNAKLKAKAFQVAKGLNAKPKARPANNKVKLPINKFSVRASVPWNNRKPAQFYRVQYFTSGAKTPVNSEWQNMRQKIISNVIHG